MPYYIRGMNAGSDDDDDHNRVNGDNEDDNGIDMLENKGLQHQIHSQNGIDKELDEISTGNVFDKDAISVPEHKGVKQTHSHSDIDKELDEVSKSKDFGNYLDNTKPRGYQNPA